MSFQVGEYVRIRVGGRWRPRAGDVGLLVAITRDKGGCAVEFDDGSHVIHYDESELVKLEPKNVGNGG